MLEIWQVLRVEPNIGVFGVNKAEPDRWEREWVNKLKNERIRNEKGHNKKIILPVSISSLQTTSIWILFFFPLMLISLFSCFVLSTRHAWECVLTERKQRSPELLTANHYQLWTFNRGGGVFVCECSAGDYSSNDNSTYGGCINLPEHWDHKSNLRLIILLPDEELKPNVVQWSEWEDVFVVVWYWGMFTNHGEKRTPTCFPVLLLKVLSFYLLQYYNLKWFWIKNIYWFSYWHNYVPAFKLPTSFVPKSGIFFPPFFCYCVNSPCTNPTVLLLSSGPWKWTGCKTCRVHVNQIRTETPP